MLFIVDTKFTFNKLTIDVSYEASSLAQTFAFVALVLVKVGFSSCLVFHVYDTAGRSCVYFCNTPLYTDPA